MHNGKTNNFMSSIRLNLQEGATSQMDFSGYKHESRYQRSEANIQPQS